MGLTVTPEVLRTRVAAPSVCCAAACILLAAAPTATPCFRRWRRSSLYLREVRDEKVYATDWKDKLQVLKNTYYLKVNETEMETIPD